MKTTAMHDLSEAVSYLNGVIDRASRTKKLILLFVFYAVSIVRLYQSVIAEVFDNVKAAARSWGRQKGEHNRLSILAGSTEPNPKRDIDFKKIGEGYTWLDQTLKV
jgi:hypothetical protein